MNNTRSRAETGLGRNAAPTTPLVWDNHVCPPMEVADLPRHLPRLEALRDAGCHMVSLNIGYGEMSFEEHLAVIAGVRRWLGERQDRFSLVERTADIAAARATGRLAVAFDVEGAAPVEGHLDRVNEFYRLGVRWMLLAYNRNNWAASGIHGEDTGLTKKGRALIRRMEQVGMVVCLSHTSARAAEEALGMAEAPMIFSHSNPQAVEAHPRNISDRLIRECARTGGVVGINGLELFIGQGRTSAAGLADHLSHVASVAGAEHCGLGTDYVFDLDGLNREKSAMADSFPPGWGYEADTVCTGPDAIRDLPEELSRRGWGDTDIAGALGLNWLRVAERCWKPVVAIS